MKGSPVPFVVGSSLCLASVPPLVFPSTQAPLVRRMSSDEPVPSIDGWTTTDFIHHGGVSGLQWQAQGLSPFQIKSRHTKPPVGSVTSPGSMNSEVYLLARLQPRRPARTKVKLRYLTVQSGDTLWGISRRYKVPLSSLEQWNHLSVDSALQIGQRLQMFPPPGGVARSQVRQAHQARQATRTPRAESAVLVGTRRSTQSKSRVQQALAPLSSRSEPVVGHLATGLFGMQMVQYAEKFLGVPYRWGGESPSTGFDCSGLVQFVLAHFGITVGRSSYAQFQAGTAVYRSDLMPGDLVFFDTDGAGPSHVGIYIGNQRFISASGSAVSISSLSQSYWALHYLGGRRVGT